MRLLWYLKYHKVKVKVKFKLTYSIKPRQNCNVQTTPSIENFVVINQIDILDPSEVTDADLEPVKNTLMTTPAPDSGSSSGGYFAGLTALCLLSFSMRKLIIKAN
jgi:peptidyl-prolyl cis-trans isomerase A (cyclophilin A)